MSPPTPPPKLPQSLAEHARTVRLAGSIPALLVHPDWITPAPTVVWLHGRTAFKELDPGRYARWLKHGVAACAIDLPGHGERADHRSAASEHTLAVLGDVIPEIDHVVEELADPIFQGVFDLDRLGLGGMSLGGMATLRRLCDRHEFKAAAVEATTGDLWSLYKPGGPMPWGQTYDRSALAGLDPSDHLEGFRPVPLLVLHTEADRIVPWAVQAAFVERLRRHYADRGADPGLIEVQTWPQTGAPEEHSGFGRVSHEAKTRQAAFWERVLASR